MILELKLLANKIEIVSSIIDERNDFELYFVLSLLNQVDQALNELYLYLDKLRNESEVIDVHFIGDSAENN